MKIRKNKNQLLIICLVVGFLIGIIYQNIISGKQVMINELFLISNLQRYLQMEVLAERYAPYVIKSRVLLCGIVSLFGCIRWKKAYVLVCMLITGFLFGITNVAAVLQLGMKGVLLCAVGVLPQGIFYTAQYAMLFIYWFRFPEKQWNRTKTIFVITMFLVGIIVEIYVNPILMKWVVGWIC